MNPFRALADALAGRPPIDRNLNEGAGFYVLREPTGGNRPASLIPVAPLTPEWREAMGRGGTDCHVRDHRDALQQLGHTLEDLHRLEGEYRHLWDLHRAVTEERDVWRARARTAEAKLRHPSTGDLAA